MAMAADDPDRYVAKMTKALREGRIFIDYLRNSLEQTSVAAYSTRARAGAPVSVPVTWEELGRTKGANQYTVLNLAKRLGALKQDPWAEMNRVRQALPAFKTSKRATAFVNCEERQRRSNPGYFLLVWIASPSARNDAPRSSRNAQPFPARMEPRTSQGRTAHVRRPQPASDRAFRRQHSAA